MPTFRPRMGEPVCGRCSTRTFLRTAAMVSSRSAIPSVDPSSTKITSYSSAGSVCSSVERMHGSAESPGLWTLTITLTFTPMRSACVVPPAGARRLADYRRKDGLLIPSPGLGVPPGSARRAVAALDVAESPLDLGGGVGLPVGAGAGHLAAGQRLRDAVRAG